MISIIFKSMKLIPGKYWVDIGVQSPSERPFDFQMNVMSFKLESQTNEVGIALLDHEWEG
jgi:hypothetical protein